MADIQPFARLIRLTDDVTLAQTANVLDGTFRESVLDAAGSCGIITAIADAGTIPGGGQAFATALLSGAGGAGLPGTVTPLLLSLSLDGGTTYDTHRLVQAPRRDADQLTLSESGTDVWDLYGLTSAGGGHQTVATVALADLLGKGPDSIVTLASPAGILSADGTLGGVVGLLYPHFYGTYSTSVLYDIPGNPAWNSNSLKRLRFTGVVGQDIAFALPTTEDTYEDSVLHAIAVITQRLSGYLLSGDTFPLGSRHYVADCSDWQRNLARHWAGVVCDGSPTSGSLAGTNGLSNARTGGFEVRRTLNIGSVGVASGLTFDGDTTAHVIDETMTALIGPGATLEPDLSVLHGRAAFIGGNSDAGFPSGATITALTVLNRDAHDDAITTCLPLVGLNVSDKSGGVYYWDGIAELVPLNLSQSLPVLDLCVDTTGNVINVATPHGCLHRTTDITNTTAPWTQIGGLTARVVRMALPLEAGTALLFALVQDTQNSQLDGVYIYTGGGTSGLGYNGWVRKLSSSNILDMVATDNHSFFYLDKSDQTKVYLFDFASSPSVTTAISLPANVVGIRLDRVTSTAADTVWITVIDSNASPQSAYYLHYNGTNWTANGVVAGQLAVGKSLKVNRFSTVQEAINVSASQVTPVRIFAATDDGLYYGTTNTPTISSDWKSANAQSGLQGVAITNAFCGRSQFLVGIETSRLFATTDTSLYVSHNSGMQWDEVTRGKVDAGAYLRDAVVATTSALPTNKVQTVGPMATSPISAGAGTHVQVATYLGLPFLPTGWYWQRRLTQRYQWRYILVNPACPFANELRAQLSQFEANESQTVSTASALLASAVRVLLGQSSQPQIALTLQSSFTQDNAALRDLQPTMTAHVTYHGTIAQKAADGTIVDTTYLNLNDDFYVLSHRWSLENGVAVTQTRLSNVLRTQVLSPDDVATNLQEQIRVLRVYGTRRPRA
jgi:hypothetical protein